MIRFCQIYNINNNENQLNIMKGHLLFQKKTNSFLAKIIPKVNSNPSNKIITLKTFKNKFKKINRIIYILMDSFNLLI